MKQNKNSFIWGIFFLACALLVLINFILGQIGWDFHFSIIKLIVTLFLGSLIVDGFRKVDFFSILIPVALIFMMYDDLLGIDHDSFSILLMALFAAIGLSILFPSTRRKEMRLHMQAHASTSEPDNMADQQEYQSPHFTYKNYFNSSIRYINCDAFLHGDVDNCFGSMKLYFDNAMIHGDSATLHINVAFGSLILYVPSTWQIQENIQAVAAPVKVQTPNIPPQGPVLQIYGDATFSSVIIQYI